MPARPSCARAGVPHRPTHDPSEPGPTARPDLAFPDAPRLELDALLEQLMQRAQEVLVTQGRLRGLLRANRMLIADLGLEDMLRRIVEAARELVGARYAALGVIAADGHLAQFVHTGMDDDVVAGIGDLPQGKGLLGALIDDPTAIRLDHLDEDPRATGLPPRHPPMTSFLGVPIRVRDQVFGNLSLAEAAGGAFTAEDEELATALAASAGAMIDNARLFEAARAGQQWLRASAAITRRLLDPGEAGSGDLAGALRLIAESFREVARADLVTVVLPRHGPDGVAPTELHVHTIVGEPGTDELLDRAFPDRVVAVDGSLSGDVFTTGEPRRVGGPDESGSPRAAGAEVFDVGPLVAVPLQGSRRRHGVLVAARRRGRAEFDDTDLELAAGFGNQTSVALELAEARAEQQRAVLLDDRDRIAADLRDQVLQRLFATGLSLQGLATRLAGTADGERVTAAIDELDSTISRIRSSVFDLRSPATEPRDSSGRADERESGADS